MSWIKLQHDLPQHPKALKAGPEAMWLFVSGLCYCNRQTTDGLIPAEAIPTLTNIAKPAKAVAALVATGLWEEVGSDYRVPKYLDFQRSAADIKAQSKRNASNGRSGGLAKAQRRSSDSLATRQAPASRPAVAEEEKEEDKEKTLKASPLPAEAGSVHFEDFWAEYPAQPNGSKPEKKKAHDQWVRLKAPERTRAFASLPNYRRHLQQLDRSAKYAERYLRDRTFEDFQAAPLELVNGKPQPVEDIDAEVRKLVARAQ